MQPPPYENPLLHHDVAARPIPPSGRTRSQGRSPLVGGAGLDRLVKRGQHEPVPTTAPSDAGIEIWYTTDGDPSAEPLLMVMGLGAQLIAWDEGLVATLVDRGYYVIRFDNRDVGLSTKPDVGDLDTMAQILAAWGGETAEPPYLLRDMAADAVAVLDALGVASAHVVGASMGGMIAQTIAIEHPDRVRSLTSIMSTTGAPDVGQPTPDVLPMLLGPAPTNRDEAVARGATVSVAIGSPGLVDEAEAREKAGRAWDRCAYPEGTAHQLLAIISSGDRTDALRRLDLPTLVVHGDADPLVTPSGGRATAEAIPGAELILVEGMGHDVPPVHWDRIVDAIAATTAKAAAPAA